MMGRCGPEVGASGCTSACYGALKLRPVSWALTARFLALAMFVRVPRGPPSPYQFVDPYASWKDVQRDAALTMPVVR